MIFILNRIFSFESGACARFTYMEKITIDLQITTRVTQSCKGTMYIANVAMNTS